MKLPLNCEVNYYDNFLKPKEAEAIFSELNELMKKINFNPKTVDGRKYEVNFGKIMFVDQKLIDGNKFPEEIWGTTRGWFGEIRKLKEKIEKFTGQIFQVCVLIHYPNGNAGVDFHSDYPAFGDTSFIPSISLGEEREFKFREKESGSEFSMILSNGSLVIMGKHCQERYDHSLPVNPEYKNARINLTFRKYGFEN